MNITEAHAVNVLVDRLFELPKWWTQDDGDHGGEQPDEGKTRQAAVTLVKGAFKALMAGATVEEVERAPLRVVTSVNEETIRVVAEAADADRVLYDEVMGAMSGRVDLRKET